MANPNPTSTTSSSSLQVGWPQHHQVRLCFFFSLGLHDVSFFTCSSSSSTSPFFFFSFFCFFSFFSFFLFGLLSFFSLFSFFSFFLLLFLLFLFLPLFLSLLLGLVGLQPPAWFATQEHSNRTIKPPQRTRAFWTKEGSMRKKSCGRSFIMSICKVQVCQRRCCKSAQFSQLVQRQLFTSLPSLWHPSALNRIGLVARRGS